MDNQNTSRVLTCICAPKINFFILWPWYLLVWQRGVVVSCIHRMNEVNPRRAWLYDTIRDAILTCARKPTWVSLIYRTETTTKKCKTEKLESEKRICSKVTVNSQGNPCSQSWQRPEGYGGKDLQKRKVLSLEWKNEGVMDAESGESMELVEEVPVKELGEAELERLVRGWRREAGSWFQRRGEAYWKERSVIRREDDADGRVTVTKDERVLQGGWTVMRLCRYEGWVAVRTL